MITSKREKISRFRKSFGPENDANARESVQKLIYLTNKPKKKIQKLDIIKIPFNVYPGYSLPCLIYQHVYWFQIWIRENLVLESPVIQKYLSI